MARARPDSLSLLPPQIHTARAAAAEARGTSATGTMSAGAVAIGAIAIGAVAVGRLAVKRATIKRLEIDELVVRRLQVDEHGGTTRAAVAEWVAGYERAWRAPGTDALLQLFTAKASYSPGPFEPTLRGLPAIAEFWETERDTAEEAFTLTTEQIAVDGTTAIVRTEVSYVRPERQQFRNLWVIGFAPDGRAQSFEEWSFAPGADGPAGATP
jgi:ketosteroid isomerase-like protein